MKRRLFLISILCILMLSTVQGFAMFNDVPDSAVYAKAVNHLAQLDIIKGVGDGNFGPDNIVTREQFTKMFVSLNGWDEEAKVSKDLTIFRDVNSSMWSSGFIQVAVKRGILKGMADGNFHPTEGITYAQATTIAVRALGYADTDLSGLWPGNYVEKARTLELTKDMNFGNDDFVPRWSIALLLDRMLSTNMKKANATEADKTFAAFSGFVVEGIVLANSKTSDKLLANQVQTETGIYYLNDKTLNLDLGTKYSFIIDKTNPQNILKAAAVQDDVLKGTVLSNGGTSVMLIKNGKQTEMTLPDKTVYYYNGVKQSYDAIKGLLSLNSSIIMAHSEDKKSFDYGVIFDPQYSRAQVVKNQATAPGYIGNIKVNLNTKILKEGKQISNSDVKALDVVYEVSDVWGGNGYVYVIDNKIVGILTAVLPSKASPKTLKVDTTSYVISKDIDLAKISTYSGLIDVNKTITLILGRDDQVVDFVDSTDNLGIIINGSTSISTEEKTKGKRIYKVKILTSNGVQTEYKTTQDYTGLRGSIVRFNYDKEDNTFITLEFSYIEPVGDLILNQENLSIGSSYIADNIKIFNIISTNANEDVVVNVVNWNDVPSGLLKGDKIKFLGRTGDFGDVEVLVVFDLYDNWNKVAYVKDLASMGFGGGGGTFTYNFMIDNTAYSFREKTTTYVPKAIEPGQVYKVVIKNGAIKHEETDKLDEIVRIDPVETGKQIQAIDRKKIKINDNVYLFKSNVTFFLKKKDSTVINIGATDISKDKQYGKINVFLDKTKDNGGKVEIITVEE